MRIFASASILVLLLALAGCGGSAAEAAARQLNHDAQASGSPFRTKLEKFRGGTLITTVMIDLPHGDTKADDLLKKDILSQLKKVELSQHRGAPEVNEVRLLPDGREVWILKNKTQGVAYIVTLRRAQQGGTYFSITGPRIFKRG